MKNTSPHQATTDALPYPIQFNLDLIGKKASTWDTTDTLKEMYQLLEALVAVCNEQQKVIQQLQQQRGSTP
jgi:hypothetical protein